MQNRFGFKDFVVILLLVLILVTLWLGMKQRDNDITALRGIEQHLAEIAAAPRAAAPAPVTAAAPTPAVDIDRGPGKTGGSGATTAGATSPGKRDESWARPGAPVEWQEPWVFATDPASQPGFQPGGSFTEIFEARPAKITPNIQTDVYGRRAVDQVMQSLGNYDPQTLRLRGVLAEAWQMDPGGMWMRAKIRDNAVFSDGTPVTAEDLRWSFHDFIMNTEIEAQRDRSVLSDQIDQVKVLSERVVEITFKQRLFNNLDQAATIFVLPKHFYSKFSPADINKSTGLLMGSGPFKLANLDPDNQWTPGNTVELVRNDKYWGPRPPLDKMRFRDIQEELPRLTAYRNGEGDMITPSAPQFVSLLQDSTFAPPNNQMLKAVTMRSGRGGIIWNCGERGATGKLTPFHDKRVRQAMTLLLDREKMIRDIWKGVGFVAKGFMNPNFEGADPDIKAWPFDPPRAIALLKEAGWQDRDGNGVLENEKGEEFEFEFTFFTGGEIAQRIATFVQDAYKSAGIKVVPKGVDWSVGDSIRKQRDYDAMIMSWGANAPESDPKQIFHSESIKDQGDNFGQWNCPAADKAIDALRLEVDFKKRMEHWREFDRAMHDDQPYTWIRLQPELRIIKPDIGNARQYPKGIEHWEFFHGAGPLMPAKGT